MQNIRNVLLFTSRKQLSGLHVQLFAIVLGIFAPQRRYILSEQNCFSADFCLFADPQPRADERHHRGVVCDKGQPAEAAPTQSGGEGLRARGLHRPPQQNQLRLVSTHVRVNYLLNKTPSVQCRTNSAPHTPPPLSSPQTASLGSSTFTCSGMSAVYFLVGPRADRFCINRLRPNAQSVIRLNW